MGAPKDIPSGRCAACKHSERTRFELMLAGGASMKSVATKFSLQYFSLRHHWMNHVSPERRAKLVMGPVQRQALAARVSEESESVLDHFKAARTTFVQQSESISIRRARGSGPVSTHPEYSSTIA